MARQEIARAAILIVVALTMTACPGSSQSVPDPDPSGSPAEVPSEVTLGSGCDNEARVVTPPFPEPNSGTSGALGGKDYEALILTDDDVPSPCSAFLVFGWAGDYSSTNIEAEITPGFGFPTIVSVPDVDGDDTPEVFVLVAAGASTQFGLLYTLDDGVIREVALEGSQGPGNLIAYGGSVGHLDGAWCDPGTGRVVLSSAVPEEDRYRLERRYHRLEGGTLVPDGAESMRVSSQDLGGLPDFSGEPFGRCPG